MFVQALLSSDFNKYSRLECLEKYKMQKKKKGTMAVIVSHSLTEKIIRHLLNLTLPVMPQAMLVSKDHKKIAFHVAFYLL